MPIPAKIQNELKAGSSVAALTRKATQSVKEVIRIETPAMRIVLDILLSLVMWGLT